MKNKGLEAFIREQLKSNSVGVKENKENQDKQKKATQEFFKNRIEKNMKEV